MAMDVNNIKPPALHINAYCMECMFTKQLKYSRTADGKDEAKRTEFLKELSKVLAESDGTISSTRVTVATERIYEKFYGRNMQVEDCRWLFNRTMLEAEGEIEAAIAAADDPLLMAIKYSLAANYIDTGTVANISRAKLMDLLHEAADKALDENEYKCFLEELSTAKNVLYLTDNSGEIVADKLVMRRIKERFPGVRVTAMVRGLPTLNDATREDAEFVGLTKEVRIIDNGTDIPGTEYELLPEDVKKEFLEADVIISKGMGNFESLFGRNFNVYFLLLCKCEWFGKFLGLPLYAPIFCRDQRVKTVPGVLENAFGK